MIAIQAIITIGNAQDLRDMTLNVVAAVVAFILGTLTRSFIRSLRMRRARRFWGRSFSRGAPLVLLGHWQTLKEQEPSGLIGLGDSSALQAITVLLLEAGIEAEISSALNLTSDQYDRDLIAIGAGGINAVSDYVASVTPTTYGWSESPITISHETSGETYTPEWVDPNHHSLGLRSDFAVLIRATSPMNPRRTVLLLCGAYGFGTWGAVHLLANERFRKEYDQMRKRHGTPNFECLMKVDVLNGNPCRPRIVRLEPLAATD